MEGMRKEMASIRKLLEHQISGLMWQEVERREPMRALLIKELKKMGFDDAFADQLAGLIPEDMPIHQAMAQLAEVLTAQLKISEDEILRQGGRWPCSDRPGWARPPPSPSWRPALP
jgi:flagellar biosynthesis protein FlhF